MRLLRQQRPDGPEAPPFGQPMLQPDLLSRWTPGGPLGGGEFWDRDPALHGFGQGRDRQPKPGLQLMFAQGEEAR